MAIPLNTMVAWLQAAIGASTDLYANNNAYHQAIQAAGEEFLAVSRAAVSATSITVNSGVTSVNVTSTIAGFTQGDLVGQQAYISSYEVQLVGYQKLARRLQGTPATGRPTMMAFLADNALYFDKQTDQGYTLVLPHVARLTSFSPGDATNPTLNLPAADAARIAYTGCVWYLLKGQVDEGGEIANAFQGWQALLAEARTRYPSTTAAVRDRQVKQ